EPHVGDAVRREAVQPLLVVLSKPLEIVALALQAPLQVNRNALVPASVRFRPRVDGCFYLGLPLFQAARLAPDRLAQLVQRRLSLNRDLLASALHDLGHQGLERGSTLDVAVWVRQPTGKARLGESFVERQDGGTHPITLAPHRKPSRVYGLRI